MQRGSRFNEFLPTNRKNFVCKESDELPERGLIGKTGKKTVLDAAHVLRSFGTVADDYDIPAALV